MQLLVSNQYNNWHQQLKGAAIVKDKIGVLLQKFDGTVRKNGIKGAIFLLKFLYLRVATFKLKEKLEDRRSGTTI